MMPLLDTSPVEAKSPASSPTPASTAHEHSGVASGAVTPAGPGEVTNASSMTPSTANINLSKTQGSPAPSPRATKGTASIRRFSTTPINNAMHDRSTIDFAFFPTNSSIDLEVDGNSITTIRVPLLPDVPASLSSSMLQPPETPDEVVFRGEINTMVHESTLEHPPSVMSDVVDNAAIQIDPFDLSSSVEKAARKMTGGNVVGEESGETKKGVLREVWDGLVEDLMGGPRLKTA